MGSPDTWLTCPGTSVSIQAVTARRTSGARYPPAWPPDSRRPAVQACRAGILRVGSRYAWSLVCFLMIRQAGPGGACCRRRFCVPWLSPGHGGRVGWWWRSSASAPAVVVMRAGTRRRCGCRPGGLLLSGAAELGEIAARLGRYAGVTLVGVGGVGKAGVAGEAAWIEVSGGRAELACYVDLVPCRTDDQVIAALVEGVGIRGAQAAAGVDAVADAVSGCRSLLVIDNCEHVLESVRRACEQLAGRAAGLRLLVTSRIPLDIEPECVWRLPPMAVPGEAGGPVVTEAVTLFFARAAMAGVTLQAGPAELALASTICRKAGGLPLAIELVANRLRVASLTELVVGLGSSGWPARSAGRGRHDSLDACLTWSHALLSADAAVVFRPLSVFPWGFDLAAAPEGAGTQPVEDGPLGALVGQPVTASLLEADPGRTTTPFRLNHPG